MITKLLKIIFRNFPKIKGIIWKTWYTYLGSKVITTDLKFMNYGYFSENFHPKLSNHDEKERYPIHLYHYLCSKINLYDLNVLEIGSGRGGGADYISRTFQPKEMYAIDISKSVIKLCNKFYANNPKVNFIYGNAEKIPFNNNTFDVVLNVESSHCYPSFNNFLKEVVRVLKKSGYFLITDFRPNKELKTFRTSIKNNFEIIHEEEITKNILSALDLMSEKRSKQIKNLLPNFLMPILSSFAGLKNSELYKSFENKELRYFIYVLKSNKK